MTTPTTQLTIVFQGQGSVFAHLDGVELSPERHQTLVEEIRAELDMSEGELFPEFDSETNTPQLGSRHALSEPDFRQIAEAISQKLGRPVELTWNEELLDTDARS